MKSKIVLPVGLAAGVLAFAGLAISAVPTDSSGLRAAVTLDGVRGHQWAFQAIADANGGVRLAGTLGYDESAYYVAETAAAAGYDVTLQPFDFIKFEPLGLSNLEQTAPNPAVYVEETDFNVMSQSEPGDVTGLVTAVDVVDLTLGNASTSGCEASDFTGFPIGHIALVQRGACSFQLKAENAANAGAIGAIIFNQGNTEDRKGLINGTLGAGYSGGIPVFFATFDRGVEWLNTAGLELHMIANVIREPVTTFNVIAESPGGRDDRVVVVGAHLDSVPQGPGINDNGSGSAAQLEIALQMAALGIQPRNKVRFAWWSAEESGLVGAQYYVDNLTARDIKNIALNLNFDMVGSPNFVRFVYDGDGSDTPLAGPNGSGNIEQVFLDYFAGQGLAAAPTAFSGRSDYGPFIAVGIPAGGLFTGAEGIKTEEQAAIYGGTAGDSVLAFAMTTSAVNGTDKGSAKAMEAAASMEMLGSHYRQ
jgi:Zn-dependent M28 family amino/carboxypeptidase